MTHPAGGIWHYEPNHDYVAHLDDVFRRGNAPRLAGMLLSLANPSNVTGKATPCYLNIPWVVPTANDGEFTSHEVTGSEQLGADVYSILQGSVRSDPMPDLTVEQFFQHADVLSGQDVGKVRPHLGTKLDRLDLMDGGFVERAVTALDDARAGDATSIWTLLAAKFLEESLGEGTVWHDWTGQAATEAKEKFVNVGMWFCKNASDGVFRQDALRTMSYILIKYAATIHGARMNLDNLMGELVDQVNEWNDKTDLGASPGKWVALGLIKDLATKNQIGTAYMVVDAVTQAADGLTAEKKLDDNQIYHKLMSYLDAAEGVVRETDGEVEALVRELNHVRDARHDAGIDIPVWTE